MIQLLVNQLYIQIQQPLKQATKLMSKQKLKIDTDKNLKKKDQNLFFWQLEQQSTQPRQNQNINVNNMTSLINEFRSDQESFLDHTKNDQFTICYASFKINKYQMMVKLTKQQYETISFENWYLWKSEFWIQNFTELFKEITETSVIALYLQKNYHPTMLKEIQHINFTHLKALHLNKNQIDSIQPLQFLNLRSLQVLNLYENKFCQLKVFTKIRLPNIKCLKLQCYNSNGIFKNQTNISRIDFSSKNRCLLKLMVNQSNIIKKRISMHYPKTKYNFYKEYFMIKFDQGNYHLYQYQEGDGWYLYQNIF